MLTGQATTSVGALVAGLVGHGLALRRAAPRKDGLTFEALTPDGRVVGGCWFPDVAAADAAVAGLDAVHGTGAAHRLPGTGVVLQPGGRDARIRTLAAVAGAPGATLLGHRVGRRGVVRDRDGGYTKVVSRGLLPSVVGRLTEVRPAGVALPRVLAVDPRRGCVTTTALPGVTWRERLADQDLPDAALVADAAAVGAAVAGYHRQPPVPGVVHDAAAELADTVRWLAAGATHDVLPEATWRRQLDRVAAALLLGPGAAAAPARLHRDLHERQILLAAAHAVGLVDLDGSCTGEAALDLGNLLAHLDLGTLLGRYRPERTASVRSALLAGYAPTSGLRRRLPAYQAVARLRLASVYAFRAAPEPVVRGLLAPAEGPP